MRHKLHPPAGSCYSIRVRRFERVARAAIARAGGLIRTRHGGRHAVAYKSAVDVVTATDRQAELIIVEALHGAFPDHGIVSEESPPLAARSDYVWYVDPLDGTTNFVHGYPHCAVSIALAHRGELALGLVHDPLRRETFSAQRGGGAQLNGHSIDVSDVEDLSHALVGAGFPHDRREHADAYVPSVQAGIVRTRSLRWSGSAALDLCYVACGRLDAYWEWHLGPWDVGAGRLIVEEAGGKVTDFSGGSHTLLGPETAASNGHLHEALVTMLTDARRTGSARPT
jgi:myo-inositol-1(or 4)-monophosphatase